MNIIADTTIPYLKGVLEPVAQVTYLDAAQFTAETVREADALIVRSIDKCTRALLEGSRVRLITTATIGFDHIDTGYCDAVGIKWRNAPGCNAVSVAQYVAASLVRLSLQTGEPLTGKTIGIVGVGHVGREVERVADALGMRLLRNDPPRADQEGDTGFVSLQAIAEEADVITFHVPLERTGKYPTYHLADGTFLRSLQKRPWVINASRGGVHDTKALLEARRNGKIGQLVLDCWEGEPDIDRALLQQTTIATPHIAGFSADGKANATRMCLEEIKAFFGVKIEKLHDVLPPPLTDPVIDLSLFDADRVSHAILTSFDPLSVDQYLRETPERFEWFRAHYPHPREFRAYRILHATAGEQLVLKTLGFELDPEANTL